MISDLLRSRAVVVLVTLLCVAPAAGLALQQGSPADGETEPGAQFAGVIGVQGAEVDGAVEGRAFGRSVAAAASNESRAGVVAGKVTDLRARLTELRQRRDSLRTALENGSMNRSQYRARLATVAARTATVQEQLNRSQSVATNLPEQARAAAGLNVSAIERLRTDARNLSGGEVSEIARSIAGRGVGRGIPATARGPPEDRGNGSGPPEDRGNGSGPPDEPGEGDRSDSSDGDRGNSGDDRGNSGNATDGDPGNSGNASSGDRGNGSDAPGANGSDAGNSENAGSGDNAGDGSDAGASGSAGDGSDAGARGDRGNCGDAGSDDADGSDATNGSADGTAEGADDGGSAGGADSDRGTANRGDGSWRTTVTGGA